MVRGRVAGRKRRVGAGLEVKVRFAMRPIAENIKMVGVCAQLLAEVEDVTVRVALTENRDVAEDVPLKAKSFAEGLDEALPGQLGSSVEGRLRGKRRVLWRGKNVRLAVDGTRRAECDAL